MKSDFNIKARLWDYIDLYPFLRPFLFQMDPEKAHSLTIAMLRYGWGPHFLGTDDPILSTNLLNLNFSNPIGLAAGLDREATATDELLRFGFGFSEIGGVVRYPQPGNPKPRLFRIPEAKAIINRFGFNSDGVEIFAKHMKAWRTGPNRIQRPVGVNIAKNKECADATGDYVACLIKLAPYADFVTINVSSPNTPGLRDLQNRAQLEDLLKQVTTARATHAPHLPVLIKIAPDLNETQQEDIAAVVLSSGIQGIIISNTTLARPAEIPEAIAKEAGGLSGAPLFESSTQLLRRMYQLTGGKIPLIGCGGISNGEQVYAKIRAGASLVQIYSVLIYEGPTIVRKIKRELAALLRRDGFRSVTEAVGADHKAK